MKNSDTLNTARQYLHLSLLIQLDSLQNLSTLFQQLWTQTTNSHWRHRVLGKCSLLLYAIQNLLWSRYLKNITGFFPFQFKFKGLPPATSALVTSGDFKPWLGCPGALIFMFTWVDTGKRNLHGERYRKCKAIHK